MFSEKSLRSKFLIQLALASTMLTIVFSVALYQYIKISIYESASRNLMINAKNLAKNSDLNSKLDYFLSKNANSFSVKIGYDKFIKRPVFRHIKDDPQRSFLELKYPYKNGEILILTQEISNYASIVNQILTDIVIINATMIFLIIFYALFLSRTLLLPIKILSHKLSSLDEKFLKPIDGDKIPDEFMPLRDSINRLIERIQTFVLYQKELFVGVAHELKTPLAVMKTKNEVTLLKKRESEKYIEALKSNNVSIDNMNKMISSILEIGRQEGAQLEEPEVIDIVLYLKEICKNFEILAKNEKKNISTNISPDTLMIAIQSNLFLHVVQNFVQNAIKFSPENGVVQINSRLDNSKFIVEVIDEGDGIDESLDLFAPFKRYGNKQGSGLGLFLAKGAAQALRAEVYIKNRKDGKSGAVATFILPVEK